MQNPKLKTIFLAILCFSIFGLAESSEAVYPVAGRRKFLLTGFLFSFLFLFASLSFASPAYGADHYIREGAVGSADGTDWANAFTNLPSNLIRGDVYYIADGSYGNYIFDDVVSGARYIYLRKATVVDHSINAGWDDSYGDGEARFSSWTFETDYWDIDGQVGKWASDIPGYEAYGFIVSTEISSDNQKIIKVPSPGAKYISIKHVEAYCANVPITGTWYKGMDIVFAYGSHVAFEYCWFHDAGRVTVLSSGCDYMTFDHCVFEKNGRAQQAMAWEPSEHSELVMFQPDADYGVIRHSYIRDWRSTGGIILYTENDHMEFYGNIFTLTGGYTIADENGAINGRSAATNLDAVVYNNTFVDINYGANVLSAGSYINRNIQGNIFYNSTRNSSSGVTFGDPHDYNWFYNSGTISETNIQNGDSDLFIDRINKDFRLKNPTNPSINLGAPYNVDMNGKMRGEDGTWDRGAYEYVGAVSDTTAPVAPSGLSVN